MKRIRAAHSILLPVAACALWFAFAGCGYPEVSPKTYDIAKALYSACNRRDERQLSKVSEVVQTAQRAQEINDTEAGWLNAIVAQARGGAWEEAALEARQLMEDQVEW